MGGAAERTTNTIRYAPYIEAEHTEVLTAYSDHRDFLLWDPAAQNSDFRPYMDYTDIEIENAFFGIGYALDSFPSLYDMYGKFMAGLDVEVLFDQIFSDTVDGTVVRELVSAEAGILEDDIIENAAPRLETGLRDINSVMSSSFVVARGMMEVARTKALSRFSADIRGKLLPLVTERWRTHLDWNRNMIEMYAQILKFYITAKVDIDSHNIDIHVKNVLWPFTILHFNTAALGVLQGAVDSKTTVAGASTAARAIGGAMQGASAGAMVGGPWGAGIGGVLGLAAGLFG